MSGDREITNSQDIIDSRDVIDRIEYLEGERSTLESAVETAQEAVNEYETPEGTDPEDDEGIDGLRDDLEAARDALKEWDESDEDRELKALKSLQDEVEGYCPNWKYGAALIRESYFTEYAEELAGDITDYDPRKVHWPFTCIDWEKAADELKQDYTTVDFDGVDYYVR